MGACSFNPRHRLQAGVDELHRLVQIQRHQRGAPSQHAVMVGGADRRLQFRQHRRLQARENRCVVGTVMQVRDRLAHFEEAGCVARKVL